MVVRILIADDHPIVLVGLRSLLRGRPGWEICGEAVNADELLRAAEALRPDIVLTDYHMPASPADDGVRLLHALRRRVPAAQVIVLTMLTNPAILRTILRARVQGLVLKDSPLDEVASAIAQALRGLNYVGHSVLRILAGDDFAEVEGPAGLHNLSTRELDVLRRYLSGCSVTEIARASHRSIKTISRQKIAAMRKLGASNDRELFEYAMHHGLVPTGAPRST